MNQLTDNGKLVIISAPSGAGKTTIVKHLTANIPELEFSISACSRAKRPGEVHGKDYYFLSEEEFQQKINQGAFIEWEEVYEGRYYGTLISEVQRIWEKGHHVLFEVDVIGGVNISQQYPQQALSIFLQPPSIAELKKRLKDRGAETEAEIEARIRKAQKELEYKDYFNHVIVNNDLETAKAETLQLVNNFLNTPAK